MEKIRVSIVGGSGYTGGELIRILLFHPYVELKQITSSSFLGKLICRAHPNLRKNTSLKFTSIDELEECDCLFLCLPHGESMKHIKRFREISKKIIDLGADFRLKNSDEYSGWYGEEHFCPEFINDFVYGIPEIHRDEIRMSNWVSGAGCNATAVILALYPLFKRNLVEFDKSVMELKVGSSEGGRRPSESSHHPERSRSVRSFKPTNHRHTAEILQELSFGRKIDVYLSITSVDIVRGVLATCHVFLKDNLEEKDIWRIYREEYGKEPFIRIVRESEGVYRFPEPKILCGTNYCDIGFEKDKNSNRLVIISAIDNLMKGGGGQAVQCFNIMHGFEEKIGLEFPGLHPV